MATIRMLLVAKDDEGKVYQPTENKQGDRVLLPLSSLILTNHGDTIACEEETMVLGWTNMVQAN